MFTEKQQIRSNGVVAAVNGAYVAFNKSRVVYSMGRLWGFGRSRLWCCLVIGLAVLAFGRPAQAQTPSPLAEWQYSAGEQLERLFEPTVPTWETELGIGAQYAPVFDGIGRYSVLPGPIFNVRYSDIFFASTGEGVGFNLFSFRHVRFGAAITYDLGRSPHGDGEALSGLGTIHPAPEMKIFASYVLARAFPLTIRVDARKQVGATNGYIGDLGAYLPMPGSSAKFAWFVGPTVTAADSRYMNAYFGVSTVQAAQTNYRRYKADPGFKSAGLGVSAVYFVTPHSIVDISGGFNRLLGSAAESPITQTKYDAVVSISALYKF